MLSNYSVVAPDAVASGAAPDAVAPAALSHGCLSDVVVFLAPRQPGTHG